MLGSKMVQNSGNEQIIFRQWTNNDQGERRDVDAKTRLMNKIIPREIIEFFLPIFRKHKKIYAFLIFDGIISGLSSVVMPLLLKAETDQLAARNPWVFFGTSYEPFTVFMIILGAIFLVEILTGIANGISTIYSKANKELLQNSIQLHAFKRMEMMEVGRTMSGRFNNIARLVDDSLDYLSQIFLNLPGNFLQKSIQVLGFTAIFTYFDIRLLGIVIIASLLTYYLNSLSQKFTEKYQTAWKFSFQRKQYYYSRIFLQNFPELATNGAVGSTLDSYKNILDFAVAEWVKKDWSLLSYTVFERFISSFSDILIKLIVGYGVFQGTNSIGMVALVVASMGTIQNIIVSTFQLRNDYLKLQLSTASMSLYLKMTEKIGNIGEKNFQLKKLSFLNLTFSYPNFAIFEKEYLETLNELVGEVKLGSDYVDEQIAKIIQDIKDNLDKEFPIILNNLNLEFETGKIYGIVGKNGAGKSTLMHLLAGFYRNYEGKILFNNEEIRDWESPLMAKYVSFLTQEPFYLGWGATLRENILLGVENPDEAKIWEYLEKFWLAEKIRKSEKWLDSDIGDDIEFSGGERQILAFMRLLLQDKPIIIMDEGTNQLDAENEILVFNELLKKRKEKIIIFITHRMSTISRADKIFTLENGKVEHSGTHEQLLKTKNNAYARFYKAQILHDSDENLALQETEKSGFLGNIFGKIKDTINEKIFH